VWKNNHFKNKNSDFTSTTLATNRWDQSRLRVDQLATVAIAELAARSLAIVDFASLVVF
jgi:hypothetical protein